MSFCRSRILSKLSRRAPVQLLEHPKQPPEQRAAVRLLSHQTCRGILFWLLCGRPKKPIKRNTRFKNKLYYKCTGAINDLLIAIN